MRVRVSCPSGAKPLLDAVEPFPRIAYLGSGHQFSCHPLSEQSVTYRATQVRWSLVITPFLVDRHRFGTGMLREKVLANSIPLKRFASGRGYFRELSLIT